MVSDKLGAIQVLGGRTLTASHPRDLGTVSVLYFSSTLLKWQFVHINE